ncbi:DUF4194 domain-containing protein [Curtobacterium sp. RRHDQ10]|uniref:DUF4194 domain-containing protein n=1 Tax=Curtobacterium phyllosphaerae TaxID=3413379 RepID=UPI003BEF81DE
MSEQYPSSPALAPDDVDFLATAVGAEEAIGTEDADTTFALFEGDEGRLGDAERRAFVALLRHRYVSARSHPAEWRTVLAAEHLLRSRLNDLFLELHLDTDREVAFKRQARSESTRRPFPTLLHDTAYTREETLVLVYLRMRLRTDTRPGPDEVVVDRSEILGHVAGFRPVTATDRTRDEGRVAKAIDRLVTARVLLRTTDPDRFRVASVLEVLLPLERLHELDDWLRSATETSATETSAAPASARTPSARTPTAGSSGTPSSATDEVEDDVADDPTDAPLEGLEEDHA